MTEDGMHHDHVQKCVVANVRDGIVMSIEAEPDHGVQVAMDWRTALAMGFRLVAAAEVGARDEGLCSDAADAVRISAADQVRAELAGNGEDVTWPGR